MGGKVLALKKQGDVGGLPTHPTIKNIEMWFNSNACNCLDNGNLRGDNPRLLRSDKIGVGGLATHPTAVGIMLVIFE
jgi:hypothetical protein